MKSLMRSAILFSLGIIISDFVIFEIISNSSNHDWIKSCGKAVFLLFCFAWLNRNFVATKTQLEQMSALKTENNDLKQKLNEIAVTEKEMNFFKSK